MSKKKTKQIDATDVLNTAIQKIAKEVNHLQSLPTLNSQEARSLVSYTQALVTILREQRLAAEDEDLKALENADLAELVKKAEEVLRK